MALTIFELTPGDQVQLIDFGNTAMAYRRQLLSFGLTYGAKVQVLRVAPLGCPVLVEVRGVRISLRKEEASNLLWERV